MKLSILIPSKNEPYLQKTIEDINKHAVTNPEVLFEEDTGLGQRGLTTKLASQAKGDVVMKVDAHCSFSHGFDLAILKQVDHRTIVAPLLLPLDGETWTVNGKKQMAQFAFDTNLVMQHVKGDVGETMCLQGSAWAVSRRNYFDWNLGDDTMPSWGGQGTELGIKAFLNGGRCLTIRDAWYGHVFRHSDSDFPYERGENPGKQANEELIKRYKNISMAPLIEKFKYPCDWSQFELAKLAMV